METKNVVRLALLIAIGCGGAPALKDPFSGLQAGVCLDDTDCDIGRCPNACNLGQPFCTYPQVFARKDLLRKCPCIETPSIDACQRPAGEACGPQPGCVAPPDSDKVRARCIQGMCAARMTDGGVPP